MAQARTKNTESRRRDIREEVTRAVVRQLEAELYQFKRMYAFLDAIEAEGLRLALPRGGGRLRSIWLSARV